MGVGVGVRGASGRILSQPFVSSLVAPRTSGYHIGARANMANVGKASGTDAGAAYYGKAGGDAAKAGSRSVPKTPEALTREEESKNKAFRMKGLLKTLQDVSAEITNLDAQKDSSADEETANELVEMATKLQAQIRETANRPAAYK